MENSKLKLVTVLVVAGLLFIGGLLFTGYKLGGGGSVTTIDTVEVLSIHEVKGDTVFITDTLRKTNTKTIYENIYIENPIDSLLLNDYNKLIDSLQKLNVNITLNLDTLIKTSRRVDTAKIECNKIKNAITMQLRYGLEKDTIRTKTITIKEPVTNFQWDTFLFGAGTGATITAILLGIFK